MSLEDALKKRTDELQREKVTRENIENALRSADNEKRDQASSVREAQTLIDKLASESNNSRQQYEKLLSDKSKLESMVRELQGELRRHEIAPPPPPKTPSRPRASSLTNINRVATLERDVEEIRIAASASRVELDATKEKLTRIQGELVRVENEKAVLEKRLRDNNQKLKDALDDKDDMQRELDFYRTQNASAEREQELLERLEEEEKKVALLEKQLEQSSKSSDLKRTLERLKAQLNNEISRRESAETREIELVQQKEEALNELDELKGDMQEMKSELEAKDSLVKHLKQSEAYENFFPWESTYPNIYSLFFRELRNELNNIDDRHYPSSPSPSRVDETKLVEMLDAIERLRGERDQLKADIDFVQMEAHFKVQALENKLRDAQVSVPVDSESMQSQELVSRMTSNLDQQKVVMKKLQTMSSSLSVVVSHFHNQCDELQNQAQLSSESYDAIISKKDEELGSMRRLLDKYMDENAIIQDSIAELQEQLQGKLEEIENIVAEGNESIMSREEEISSLTLRLHDANASLRTERERRETVENQMQELEISYNDAKQQLEDALDECKHLEDNHITTVQPGQEASTLAKKIEVLEARVKRRNEQIGQHQHDIKRLETNLTLLEERLEEATEELELAETAKNAMVEDCDVAREEREVAQRALVDSESKVEQLTMDLDDAVKEIANLKEHLQFLESQEVRANSLSEELFSVTNAATEQEERMNTILEDLRSAEEELEEARARINELDIELVDLQTSSSDAVQQLRAELASDSGIHKMELERCQAEVQDLREELSKSRVEYEGVVNALQAKTGEYDRAVLELQRLDSELSSLKSNHELSEDLQTKVNQETDERHRLTSNLEHVRLELQEAREVVQTKEELLSQKTSELNRVVDELRMVTASKAELVNEIQLKEETLNSKIEELNCLVADTESLRKLYQDSETALSERTEQNSGLHERIALLEKEKNEISSRFSSFQAEAQQGFNETSSLQARLDEERQNHESQMKKLELDIENLEKEKANGDELQARYEEMTKLWETAKKELEEQSAHHEKLVEEQRNISSSHESEAQTLRKQVSALTTEIDGLRRTLSDETETLHQEISKYKQELQTTMDTHKNASAAEHQLRQEIENYQKQLLELREGITSLQNENRTLQLDCDNLTGDVSRANSKCRSVEADLSTKVKEVNELRNELTRVKELYSQSERASNSSEMKLLLNNQEHERAITNLRNRLKEHEKDAERIKGLQQSVAEMTEKIEEMDLCLRTKCTEIEENDDKFIQ